MATVVYLSVTRADVIEQTEAVTPIDTKNPARERLLLSSYAAVGVATGVVLMWAANQPHAASAASESESGSAVTATLVPGQSAVANFPPAEVTKFRTIAQDTLVHVQAGDQAGAQARIKDLETAWDDDQSSLQPMDDTAWTVLDGQIDSVLMALRASNPDPATETQTLTQLLTR